MRGAHGGQVGELVEGVHARVGHQDHVAAAATVAARWPAERDELFTAERHAPLPPSPERM